MRNGVKKNDESDPFGLTGVRTECRYVHKHISVMYRDESVVLTHVTGTKAR